MDYLLKVENEEKAKSLFQFLKNLDFVEIEKFDQDKKWRELVKQAEKSKSIPLKEAKKSIDSWKQKLK
jgi:hypothetical protein